MKGIVFNVLEDAVSAEHGADLWDDLLEDARLDGAYTSLGTYPDEHLGRLVAAAAARLGLGADDVVRWFGTAALPRFAERYPALFRGHGDARSFVLTLNHVIHPEVRKLYPGADVPTFGFEHLEGGRLILEYRSARQMCPFAEGLLHGTAAHFDQRVTVTHHSCMRDGADRCRMEITFTPA